MALSWMFVCVLLNLGKSLKVTFLLVCQSSGVANNKSFLGKNVALQLVSGVRTLKDKITKYKRIGLEWCALVTLPVSHQQNLAATSSLYPPSAIQ